MSCRLVGFIIGSFFICCFNKSPFSPVTSAEASPLTVEQPIQPMDLSQRIQVELANPKASLSEVALDEIRGHHHVLIPGMMNGIADYFGLYYYELKEFLDSIGADFTYQGLPTKASAVLNAEFLNLRLREIYNSQPIKKPISLRGHSKGGLECLLVILMYPDLILDNIVDRALLEQAAVRGSTLATPRFLSFLNPFSYFYLQGGLKSVHTVDAQESLDNAFDKFEEALRARFSLQLEKLTPSEKQKYLQDDEFFKTEETKFVAQKKAEISSKIRYVRTFQEQDQLSLGTRIVLWATNQTLAQSEQSEVNDERNWGDGPVLPVLSDGLVLLDHQKDDRIGSDLGILKYDHVDLFIRHLSNTTESERLAIVRAVFGMFYESEANTSLKP